MKQRYTKSDKITLLICGTAFILSLSGIVFWICSEITGHKQKYPVAVEYFKQGDTLLPDYACPDTLIVIDAAGLNKAIAPIEQGFEDATDGNISAVMYQYCIIK